MANSYGCESGPFGNCLALSDAESLAKCRGELGNRACKKCLKYYGDIIIGTRHRLHVLNMPSDDPVFTSLDQRYNNVSYYAKEAVGLYDDYEGSF